MSQRKKKSGATELPIVDIPGQMDLFDSRYDLKVQPAPEAAEYNSRALSVPQREGK